MIYSYFHGENEAEYGTPGGHAIRQEKLGLLHSPSEDEIYLEALH